MEDKIETRIEELYNLYKFNLEKRGDGYLVFSYSNGYFYNCEIILLKDVKKIREHAKADKDRYESLGYAVRFIDYISIEELHESLFKGFFDIKNHKSRYKEEYRRFCNDQTERLFGEVNDGVEYSYLSGSFFDGSNIKNTSIVDEITSRMKRKGAQLCIVEAAAGYGKTCTSYEVLNCLSEDNRDIIPFFVELSKSRSARVFRYALHDALNKNFFYLELGTVLHEIRNGRIYIIIDGFDELLSKAVFEGEGKTREDGYDNAQTMLATIADLFDEGSNAKILLTSRKSSLFTGEKFDEWVINNLRECEVTRLVLEEPSIETWLGPEKKKYIENNNIPFYGISNPIVLSLYKVMGFDEFIENCKNPESVLLNYFQSIMKRERHRQSLLLQTEEQFEIFVSLAAEFCDLDITSEEPVFLKDIFEMIIGKQDIEKYLKRYDDSGIIEEKPNEESFLQKLVRHAFLDRKSQSEQLIGFVNDFIFGFFIGEAVLKNHLEVEKLERNHYLLLFSAFSSRSDDKKIKLFDLIKNPRQGVLSLSDLLEMDIKLCGKTTRSYNNGYIESFSFRRDFVFSSDFFFKDVFFNQCTFYDNEINLSLFKSCRFVNCAFYRCKFVNNVVEGTYFISCEGVGEEIYDTSADNEPDEVKDYRKIVIEQYYRPGRSHAEPKHTFRTLLRGIKTSDYGGISNAVDELKERGILSKNGIYLELNMKKMSEINEIAGRS